MTSIASGAPLFDTVFDDIEIVPSDFYGYPFRGLCVSNIPARDKRFEYYLEQGRRFVEALYDEHRVIDPHPLLVFPERWLSQAERQQLFRAIKLAEGEVECVDVVTSDPLIVGNFHKENLRVWKEQELNERLNEFLGTRVVGY